MCVSNFIFSSVWNVDAVRKLRKQKHPSLFISTTACRLKLFEFISEAKCFKKYQKICLWRYFSVNLSFWVSLKVFIFQLKSFIIFLIAIYKWHKIRKNLLLLNIFREKLKLNCVKLLKISASQESACDSFGVENVQEEISGANSKVDCLCTNPCTSDKVKDFVRFYYIKNNSSYHQLNVTNLKASELFDFKGTVKILFHGYTAKGTNGRLKMTYFRTYNLKKNLVDYKDGCPQLEGNWPKCPTVMQYW